MSKIYFTLTGTNHYFGKEFLKKGAKIRLEKEPDNEYDKEAIKVTYEGLGKIGYVANSSYTVIGDSMSAGRIYDKIGKKAKAKVVLVTDHGTICSISKKSQLMKSNIETKMKLMERRQAVHANKIQALMLMITVMQIPEKEKNRKILKAVRVSTALLWLLTCVEDLMLMIRKNYN